MTIVKVATVNPYKVTAIYDALSKFYNEDDIDIEMINIPSGVSRQPVNSEVELTLLEKEQ